MNAGAFTIGDLKKIIPYPDPIVLLLCDGKTIYHALENSVSQYPKLEVINFLISVDKDKIRSNLLET